LLDLGVDVNEPIDDPGVVIGALAVHLEETGPIQLWLLGFRSNWSL